MVFTMPHSLHSLARRHPTVVYNILLRSAWQSLKECSADPRNLGALPGAIMVLHTFGSDLKYHVHVHALVTFGGLTKDGAWVWPKRRNKLIAYRQMRSVFRKVFIRQLSEVYATIETSVPFAELESILLEKSWCVHAEPPTADKRIISQYLGKYICRIGISKSRIEYNQKKHEVALTFKDYAKRKSSTEVPPLSKRILLPLVAIDQMMQHCLPPYFQKTRYYGLHASAAYKKYEKAIPKNIANNGATIRTIMEIIRDLLGLKDLSCDRCGHTDFIKTTFSGDSSWIRGWLEIPKSARGSPSKSEHMATKGHMYKVQKALSMPILQQSSQ